MKEGVFGEDKRVALYNNRLTKSQFAHLIGSWFPSDFPCAIDYYGLLKRSEAFWAVVRELREQLPGKQIKSIETKVVHFASIRVEQVAQLAPDLVADFPWYKKVVLDARGFQCREHV